MTSITGEEKVMEGVPLEALRRSLVDEFNISPVPHSSTTDHVVLATADRIVADEPPLPAADDAERSSIKSGSSRQNLLYVTLPNSNGYKWSVVEKSLRSASIANCDDLLAAMRQYRSSVPDLATLREHVERIGESERKKLFERVLPRMIKLVLDLPTLFPKPIPRLTAQSEMSVTMSQQQVACLLACGFFCLFGGDGGANAAAGCDRSRNNRLINFDGVFKESAKVKRRKAKIEKLACFMKYFDRVTDSMPTGVITYHRRVMTSVPDWSTCHAALSQLHVASDGFIEDAVGMLQVDFANKFVGGGVLGDGCVQEEIRFTICPELIVARLLADRMEDNECVEVIGCERFCAYDGYGDGFKFGSSYVDETPFDGYRRRMTTVVAIDATPFRGFLSQFTRSSIERELNKAYCGFYPQRSTDDTGAGLRAIATGNWGCGAYRGDHHLKALIQLIAAAANGRDVCYFTFGDQKLRGDIARFYEFARERDMRANTLWQHMMNYGERRRSPRGKNGCDENVFSFIIRQCAGRIEM